MFVNVFYCFYLKGRVAETIRNPIKKIRPNGRKIRFGSPNRIRTGVLALKGRCPRPLDDGAKTAMFILNAGKLYMLFAGLSSDYL